MSTNFQRDYRRLQLTLSRIGYFRRGTLLKRFMPCRGLDFRFTRPSRHRP